MEKQAAASLPHKNENRADRQQQLNNRPRRQMNPQWRELEGEMPEFVYDEV